MNTSKATVAACAIAAVMSCDAPTQITSGTPLIAPRIAMDHDTNPRLVEIDLIATPSSWTIAPGHSLQAWTYNGQVPGPTIEANVGDTVVVRLHNNLPEATSIHWHGIRVPAAMDGTKLTQRAVPPGGTFEYRFQALDAGNFWYHPHANEPEQMERGLYGALIVRDPAEPKFDAERVLVLDDLAVDDSGEIAEIGGLRETHDGREGRVHLINGTAEPVLELAAGQLERWRVVNAAGARYIRLSLGGRPFQLIGTDGGLLERPLERTEVLLTPGNRVDLAVGGLREGERFDLQSLPYDRGIGLSELETWGSVAVGPARPSIAALPEALREVPRIAPVYAGVTREVRLGAKMNGPAVEFLVNDAAHLEDEPVPVGQLEVWDVINETHMDHPFHLHGYFFQVLGVNGTPPGYLSLEDTVNVPAHGTVRLAFRAEGRPGRWMYHCHIIEHSNAGMMAHFSVVSDSEPAPMPMEHGHHGHH